MFHRLHPNLKAYTDCVLNHRFGVQELKADLDIRSYSNDDTNKINVSVPYCRETLTWDIIFDLDDLNRPPDVIPLNTAIETIPTDAFFDILPSIGKWCPEKETCLLDLILELIDLHRFTQIERLKSNEELNRQLFEYETLTKIGGYAKEDIEVTVNNTMRVPMCVNFYTALKLDLADLPFKEANTSAAFLAITYRIPGNVSVDLQTCTDLAKIIGQGNLHGLLPDCALIEYIPFIKQKMTEKIQKFRFDYFKKQHLFSVLASRLATSVLNADSDNFSKISFLIKRGNRNVTHLIELPVGFPNNRPVLTMEEGQASLRKEIPFSYDPAWSMERMAIEILKSAVNCKIRGN